MPEIYRVRITPRALSDLDSIFNYIKQDSPRYAAKMIETLLEAIYSLDTFPYRYAVPRGQRTTAKNIRSMVVRPYLVRYRVDETQRMVYVLHVRHGARRDA